MSDEQIKNAGESNNLPTPSTGSASPGKTPMYKASNAARYHRQEIIKKIQSKTETTLICYIAGIRAPISRDDVIGFTEMLHNIKKGISLDLMLHTPGGDIDAAEKLISLLHSWTGEECKLRVVVPDFAKSAGTLMALGANKIVMSDWSELGPIDPQVTLNDGRGNQITHSVLHYLQAYETHSKTLSTSATAQDVTAVIMLNKLDPATVKLFEAIKGRARKIAEEQLQHWMKSAAWSSVSGALLDVTRFLSHGQRIGYQDAQVLPLEVEYMAPSTELWQMYWDLYCHQRLAINDKGKLFESAYASYSEECA
jgi:ClpP class serine protease